MDESTPTCNKTIRRAGDSPDRRGPARLSGTDRHHARSRGVHQRRDPLRRDDPPAEEGRHSVCRRPSPSAGIIPGIKVDTGAKDMAGHPGEKITEGLDGLRERLEEYSRMGARFAKWRAVIALGDGIPSRGCIEANAQALARYAALCQEAGTGPRRRAGSAHGRRPYAGAVPRGDRGSPAHGLRPALRARGDAGGDDPEAQHGASGIDLPTSRKRWTRSPTPR